MYSKYGSLSRYRTGTVPTFFAKQSNFAKFLQPSCKFAIETYQRNSLKIFNTDILIPVCPHLFNVEDLFLVCNNLLASPSGSCISNPLFCAYCKSVPKSSRSVLLLLGDLHANKKYCHSTLWCLYTASLVKLLLFIFRSLRFGQRLWQRCSRQQWQLGGQKECEAASGSEGGAGSVTTGGACQPLQRGRGGGGPPPTQALFPTGRVSDPDIHLIRIQNFRLNTDPDPEFWWPKI